MKRVKYNIGGILVDLIEPIDIVVIQKWKVSVEWNNECNTWIRLESLFSILLADKVFSGKMRLRCILSPKNDFNFFNQALFQCQCHLDTPSTSRLPRSFRRSLSSAWLWFLAQIPSPRKHQHQHQQHQHHETNHPPGVTQSGEYEWRGSCKENTGQTQAASARRTFSNLFILHFCTLWRLLSLEG